MLNHQFSINYYSAENRQFLYPAAFFLMGCLWFPLNIYSSMQICYSIIRYLLVLLYILKYYKHDSSEIFIGKNLKITTIFITLWFLHTTITCLIYLTSGQNIPTLFYHNSTHAATGGVAILVEHKANGSVIQLTLWMMKTVAHVFLNYVLVCILREDKDRKLIRWFARGTIAVMPFVLMFMFSNSRFLNVARLGPARPDGSHVHPNTVGIVFLFAFYANLISAFLEKTKNMKFLHISLCILSVLFILMSGSRSCALALIFAMSYILFKINKKYLFAMLAVIAIFIMLILHIRSVFLNVNVERYLERFSIERAENDQGSGRLKTWKDYFTYITAEQLLVGVGAASTTSVIIYDKTPLSNKGFINHPSSTYIYVLLTYDLFGFILFMFFIANMFIKLFRNLKYSKNRSIDVINIGIAISNCTWGLTSYMSILSGAFSMFHVYAISQALMKPEKSNHKKIPLPL